MLKILINISNHRECDSAGLKYGFPYFKREIILYISNVKF